MKRRDFLAISALGAAALALPVALRGRGRIASGTAAARPDLRFAGHLGQRVVEGGRTFDLSPEQNRVIVSRDGMETRLEGLAVPTSVTCRGETVHVVEWGADRVGAFDPAGRRIGDVGAAGELAGPRDAAWFEDRLVVADTFHQRLAIYDRTGALRRTIGRFGSGEGELSAASSVAVDRRGRLWVADAGNARVAVFSDSGRPLGTIGGPGREEGRMRSPRCVRIDETGDIHVADPLAGVVHVFDGEGRFRQRQAVEGGLPIWLSPLPGGGMLVSVKPGRAA